MEHTIVYQEPGRFAAWPANNGVWSWEGRELLVGFTVGGFAEQPGHNILEPYESWLARSTDQGASWTPYRPARFVGADAAPRPLTAPLDFTASGFAMRVVGTNYHGSHRPDGAFYVSDDRGATWEGPFSFGALREAPELAGLDITARTEYQAEGPEACLAFMAARPRGEGMPSDRAFCARTTDGGRSFRFVGWIVPRHDPYRAVMPATARCPSGKLVAAIRRREDNTENCWIDAYASTAGGASWAWLSKVGDTGGSNGNPPAMIRLRDGRLCVVHGDRAACRIVARYSADEGASWSPPQVLRDDFQADCYDDPDLGYARVAQRSDDKLVACYYWATSQMPHQHIAATIWTPPRNQD